MLRNSVSVTGISVNSISIKLCQFADDMTLFLADVNSLTESLKIFQECYRYAGLKLNKSKTEALVTNNDGSIHEEKSIGIKWVYNNFKTLGIHYSVNSEETLQLNINNMMKKNKKYLKHLATQMSHYKR